MGHKDHSRPRQRRGRVVETRGRKVLVRDEAGERDCFLAGHRVVVGDRVQWIAARGSGGKITAVDPRRTQLRRMDLRGREQILAANLQGLLVAVSVREPGFRAALVHRYFAAAQRDDLDVVLLLTKCDLGTPPEVATHLDRLADELGWITTSATDGTGLDTLRTFLADHEAGGPWALVGGSGVGKTSLIAALLPDEEVGAIAEISDYWGTGRHTTTHSRLFHLPQGGEIVDSPGIRNLTPVFDDPVEVRLHFPVVRHLRCQYRDCQHRPGEEGCRAEDEVPEPLLDSYRTLLAEVTEAARARRP